MRWLARATLAMLAVAWADDCHDRNIDCSDWAEEGGATAADAATGWPSAPGVLPEVPAAAARARARRRAAAASSRRHRA